MKSKNPTFANSLACLQHPLSLLSIAILLLNDHVLKIVAPSWWTGKFSDFAGLFFFPFLVAAGLSLALSKFDLSPRRIGQISFGVVAIWFTLLKTVPVVNSLTAQLASLFIGAPARLILDSTDLVALVVLWPAWLLWQNRSGVAVSRMAYVSLAVGGVACLATTYLPPPVENVVALAFQENDLLYAKGPLWNQFAESTNNGEDWESLNYPDDIARLTELFEERPLQSQVCVSGETVTCYKIEGKDQVLISNDGRVSWQVAWEIPPARREFMTRVFGTIETHDLLIVEYRGSRYLFVAAGKYGILRRQLPDGEWTPLAVEEAKPFPFQAPDLSSALTIVEGELGIWAVVAFFVLLILHATIWRQTKGAGNSWKLDHWLSQTVLHAMTFVAAEFGVTLFAYIFLTLIFFVPTGNFGGLLDTFRGLAIVLGATILFLWLLVRTGIWAAKEISSPTVRLKIMFFCALTVFGVFGLGSLPYPLWAMGVIENYQVALEISIIASSLIAVLGYGLIRTSK